MSFAELARRTAHSKSAWHRYLNGVKFPPRSAVEALARLVQADERGLVESWARVQLHAQSDGGPPSPRSSPPPAPCKPAAVQGFLRSRTFVEVLVLLVLCAGSGAWVIIVEVLSHTGSRALGEAAAIPRQRQSDSVAPACRGESCEGRYAAPAGCNRDAQTESTASTAEYSVHLRYSPSCSTVWTEVHSRPGRVREISIKVEPTDEIPFPPSARFPNSSPMLATASPQTSQACGTIGGHLACTNVGGQESASPGLCGSPTGWTKQPTRSVERLTSRSRREACRSACGTSQGAGRSMPGGGGIPDTRGMVIHLFVGDCGAYDAGGHERSFGVRRRPCRGQTAPLLV